MSVIAGVLLVVVVASAIVSTLGVVLARDPFDRLHFVGPVAHVGGIALLGAVAASSGLGVATARAAVVVLILQLTVPITTHAIGRAGLVRGDLGSIHGEPPRIVE